VSLCLFGRRKRRMFQFSEIAALCVILAPAAWLGSHVGDVSIRSQLAWSAVFGIAGFLVTVWIIPNAASYLVKRGLKGLDLGKKGSARGRLEMCGHADVACSATRVNFDSLSTPQLLQSIGPGTRVRRSFYGWYHSYSALSSSGCRSACKLQCCAAVDLPHGTPRY
jgi:hypothetical protein